MGCNFSSCFSSKAFEDSTQSSRPSPASVEAAKRSTPPPDPPPVPGASEVLQPQEVERPAPVREVVEPDASTGPLADAAVELPNPEPGTEPELQPTDIPTITVDEVSDPSDLSGQLRKLKDRATKTGGFSDVWEGEIIATGQRVAIKCLRAVDVDYAKPGSAEVRDRLDKRMKREMRVWKPLENPYVVRCLGFAIVDGLPALISPWYQNGNAQEYIAENPTTDRKKVIYQVALGLAYLHAQMPPVVHHDIKMSNILIGDDGTAMLTDFGVAKVVEDIRTGLTTSNAAGLSMAYASPEAVEGNRKDVKSDVYSFACLILDILSGKPPFHTLTRHTTRMVLAKASGQQPVREDHPGLPASDPIWELLTQCWETESSKRPTMEQVLTQLEILGYNLR